VKHNIPLISQASLLNILVLFCLLGCQKENSASGNLLKFEKSPFLLQHKNNPVWWKPWKKETFQKAKKEKKLIFLSIGYSTCHWCHVMEKESFESADVAKVLNENFISIKVDREELPEVDKIYMDALISMTKSGGWPLNMFLTPDLEPIYGGTYFPKEKFLKLARGMQNEWAKRKDEILIAGKKIKSFLQNKDHYQSSSQVSISGDLFESFVESYKRVFDFEYGARKSGIKFPPTTKLRALLRIYARQKIKDPKLKDMIHLTLKKMVQGGLYDHVAGGFHRYSTDRHWLVPHFEKMLYDNAALATTYVEAFELFKDPLYLSVFEDVLFYIEREMTSPDGAFYSATDADSEGEEGVFYIWGQQEIAKALSQSEYNDFIKIFPVTAVGNFEGKNILNVPHSEFLNLSFSPKIKKIKQKLLNVRATRPPPYKDDKILTDWNGLMISAFSKASSAHPNRTTSKRYLAIAIKASHNILKHLYIDGKLKHRYRDGESIGLANLDDYAYLIQAFLDLFEASQDQKWLDLSQRLQKSQNHDLWIEDRGAYAFSKKRDDLIRQTIDFFDSARANSNGTSLINLQRLYAMTLDKSYQIYVEKILKTIQISLKKAPLSLAEIFIGADFYHDHNYEIVMIPGNDPSSFQEDFSKVQSLFLPNTVLMVGNTKSKLTIFKNKVAIGNKTTFYICQDHSCQLPVTDVFKVQSLTRPKGLDGSP
jgi:uncharacterized protein